MMNVLLSTTWHESAVRFAKLAVATLVSAACALAIGCAGSTEARPPDVPGPSASAAATASAAPCAPTDCTPCDERKQKCMGPMVCDNHPERARRACVRSPDGQCRDQIVCDR